MLKQRSRMIADKIFKHTLRGPSAHVERWRGHISGLEQFAQQRLPKCRRNAGAWGAWLRAQDQANVEYARLLEEYSRNLEAYLDNTEEGDDVMPDPPNYIFIELPQVPFDYRQFELTLSAARKLAEQAQESYEQMKLCLNQDIRGFVYDNKFVSTAQIGLGDQQLRVFGERFMEAWLPFAAQLQLTEDIAPIIGKTTTKISMVHYMIEGNEELHDHATSLKSSYEQIVQKHDTFVKWNYTDARIMASLAARLARLLSSSPLTASTVTGETPRDLPATVQEDVQNGLANVHILEDTVLQHRDQLMSLVTGIQELLNSPEFQNESTTVNGLVLREFGECVDILLRLAQDTLLVFQEYEKLVEPHVPP